MDRNSKETRVSLNEDDLLIQCGECLQVVSAGLLVATPHGISFCLTVCSFVFVECLLCATAVRASISKERGVGRATFPVFVDSGPEFRLNPPPGVKREDVLRSAVSSKVSIFDRKCLFGFHIFKRCHRWQADGMTIKLLLIFSEHRSSNITNGQQEHNELLK